MQRTAKHVLHVQHDDSFSFKGRDTLGDKSQRHVSATSWSMCTTCKTSHCDTTPVRCTRSDLVWGRMWTSFLIQYGWLYDALSLVHLYFVAATCCGKCTHDATTLLSLILSLRLVTRIQTGLNSCDWSRRQNSAAATMIFMKLTVSHKAICCGDLSPRRVAATYRLVCPGLNTSNLVISRCCFADDGTEMDKNEKRTCRAGKAIVFAH